MLRLHLDFVSILLKSRLNFAYISLGFRFAWLRTRFAKISHCIALHCIALHRSLAHSLTHSLDHLLTLWRMRASFFKNRPSSITQLLHRIRCWSKFWMQFPEWKFASLQKTLAASVACPKYRQFLPLLDCTFALWTVIIDPVIRTIRIIAIATRVIFVLINILFRNSWQIAVCRGSGEICSRNSLFHMKHWESRSLCTLNGEMEDAKFRPHRRKCPQADDACPQPS